MKYIGTSCTVFLYTTNDLNHLGQSESEILNTYGFDPKEWQIAFDDDIRAVSDGRDDYAVFAVRMDSN